MVAKIIKTLKWAFETSNTGAEIPDEMKKTMKQGLSMRETYEVLSGTRQSNEIDK